MPCKQHKNQGVCRLVPVDCLSYSLFENGKYCGSITVFASTFCHDVATRPRGGCGDLAMEDKEVDKGKIPAHRRKKRERERRREEEEAIAFDLSL